MVDIFPFHWFEAIRTRIAEYRDLPLRTKNISINTRVNMAGVLAFLNVDMHDKQVIVL